MGRICDHFGYKKSLISCYGIYLLSKIIFYKAYGFSMFLLERVLLAITVSGLSGCDSSFLCLSANQEDSTRIFGYFQACGTIGMIISSLIFSLYIKDIQLSALWTIFPYAFAFILSFFLEDLPLETTSHTSIKDCFIVLWKQKHFFLFLIASSFILETTHTITIFYSQLQYAISGIPVMYFGWISILMTIASLSSATIGKIIKYIKEKQLFYFFISLSFVTCLILSCTHNSYLSIICIMILTIIEAQFIPLSQSFCNQQVTHTSRITMLSLYSMITNIIAVITNMSFGIAGSHNIQCLMLLASLFCLISFISIHIFYRCNI